MQTSVTPLSPVKEPTTLPFLQVLRQATEQQHLALEQQPLLAAIMSPGVSVQQYAGYLTIMQHIEQAYETEVRPVLHSLFAPGTYTHASVRIANDLMAIQPMVEATALSPFVVPLQPLHTASALGFVYVMEGSKLGGKVIYKHIQRTLGFTDVHGGSFLANTGADTGREWKQFLQVFSDWIKSKGGREQAIEGARQAFTSIQQYFQNNQLAYAD